MPMKVGLQGDVAQPPASPSKCPRQRRCARGRAGGHPGARLHEGTPRAEGFAVFWRGQHGQEGPACHLGCARWMGFGWGGSWLSGVLLEESSTKSPLVAQPPGWAWDLLSSAGLHVRKLHPPSQPLRLQPPSPGSGRRGGLGMPPPGSLCFLPMGSGQGEEGSGGLLHVRAPSMGSQPSPSSTPTGRSHVRYLIPSVHLCPGVLGRSCFGQRVRGRAGEHGQAAISISSLPQSWAFLHGVALSCSAQPGRGLGLLPCSSSSLSFNFLFIYFVLFFASASVLQRRAAERGSRDILK